MTWILVLHITITTLCSAGSSCPSPSVHTQPLPGVYQTAEACEQARLARQILVTAPATLEQGGVKQTMRRTLVCQSAEGRK